MECKYCSGEIKEDQETIKAGNAHLYMRDCINSLGAQYVEKKQMSDEDSAKQQWLEDYDPHNLP